MQDGKLLGSPAIYSNREFKAFADVLEDFLAKQRLHPVQMALAVAGPLDNHSIVMTNLGWTISASALADRFGIEHVVVINDFAAIAWATLGLESADLLQIGGGTPQLIANRGVIGPGTGLGVSGLVSTGDDWTALVGEGGHVTMTATNDEQSHLLSQLVAEFGHCSAERLLSGPGLVRIYTLSGGTECSPEQITLLAREGDRVALHAVELFSDMLGTVAGNLALTLGAKGGIYLAGGILPAIKELFCVSAFRKHFESKGRFQTYLADIPTYLITHPNPGLIGLDIYLQRTLSKSK